MAALTYTKARAHGHLRLVRDDEAERRRQRELALLRRRAVAVALVVSLLVGLGVLLGRTGRSASGLGARGTSGVAGAAGTGTPLPVADRAYVVQPGDTLWHIARALQPTGDVRPLVTALQRARHGAPLRVGERIMLP